MKLLFINFGIDAAECDKECAAVKSVCGLVKVKFVQKSFNTKKDIREYLNAASSTEQYDYVYVAAHGDHEGFLTADKHEERYRWADFAADNCKSSVIKDNCVLYLGCCHGGSKTVAQIMFLNCDRFRMVAGLACASYSPEIALAFHAFMVAHLQRNSAEMISHRVTPAVGQTFRLFDRFEMQADLATLTMASRHSALDPVFCVVSDEENIDTQILLTNVTKEAA